MLISTKSVPKFWNFQKVIPKQAALLMSYINVHPLRGR